MRGGKLIAPLDGVVTALNIDPGEVFQADTPLLTIMDESSVIVHVKVPLTNLGQVWRGQSAQVTPSALPTLMLPGAVISIIPRADPQTDTFEVWVAVQNASGQLLPGMSAFVRLTTSGRAISVPRMAVFELAQTWLVFVVLDQRAYLRPVHIGARAMDVVYVDTGLARGDLVVLIGIDRLRDGQQVRIARVVQGGAQ